MRGGRDGLFCFGLFPFFTFCFIFFSLSARRLHGGVWRQREVAAKEPAQEAEGQSVGDLR